jgi:predicted nucleotide-binding protein
MKPKLFIGSSTEGKNVAEAIHAVLQREAECTVWTEGVFQLSESSLQSLMRQVHTSEFGVFVFSPDDAVRTRGTLFSVPRDNVIYELGLFSGALGPERCFFLTPLDTEIHLPSDLLGMTAGWYERGRRDENMEAAVAPFCTKVRQKIRDLPLGASFLHPGHSARFSTVEVSPQYTTAENIHFKSSQKYLKFSDQAIWLSLSVG